MHEASSLELEPEGDRSQPLTSSSALLAFINLDCDVLLRLFVFQSRIRPNYDGTEMSSGKNQSKSTSVVTSDNDEVKIKDNFMLNTNPGHTHQPST